MTTRRNRHWQPWQIAPGALARSRNPRATPAIPGTVDPAAKLEAAKAANRKKRRPTGPDFRADRPESVDTPPRARDKA